MSIGEKKDILKKIRLKKFESRGIMNLQIPVSTRELKLRQLSTMAPKQQKRGVGIMDIRIRSLCE